MGVPSPSIEETAAKAISSSTTAGDGQAKPTPSRNLAKMTGSSLTARSDGVRPGQAAPIPRPAVPSADRMPGRLLQDRFLCGLPFSTGNRGLNQSDNDSDDEIPSIDSLYPDRSPPKPPPGRVSQNSEPEVIDLTDEPDGEDEIERLRSGATGPRDVVGSTAGRFGGNEPPATEQPDPTARASASPTEMLDSQELKELRERSLNERSCASSDAHRSKRRLRGNDAPDTAIHEERPERLIATNAGVSAQKSRRPSTGPGQAALSPGAGRATFGQIIKMAIDDEEKKAVRATTPTKDVWYFSEGDYLYVKLTGEDDAQRPPIAVVTKIISGDQVNCLWAYHPSEVVNPRGIQFGENEIVLSLDHRQSLSIANLDGVVAGQKEQRGPESEILLLTPEDPDAERALSPPQQGMKSRHSSVAPREWPVLDVCRLKAYKLEGMPWGEVVRQVTDRPEEEVQAQWDLLHAAQAL
ncbi:hypothetical protein BDY21DRAFT_371896 [Lineolata rhizophorae]|uniref:BAH domain-containing protein n=1 Tax=Lineolata rhizophorae TaxID=578093 RepID=A0A6A6NZ96_9PEZI|nr:hypothetical protein BDY21DRAFT_371896 [Lineolata rhizophorae]